MNMYTVTFFWTTVIFIINCGVLAFYTPGIETLPDDQLAELNDNENSVNIDSPITNVKETVKTTSDRVETQDDYLYLRDALRPRVKTDFLNVERRSWRVPFFVRHYKPKPSSSSVNRRRTQPLSVSGPLSSLASMLAAEGRRRHQSESINNRMRLLELGKRDTMGIKRDTTGLKRDTTGLEETNSLKSDLNDIDSDLKHLTYNYR